MVASVVSSSTTTGVDMVSWPRVRIWPVDIRPNDERHCPWFRPHQPAVEGIHAYLLRPGTAVDHRQASLVVGRVESLADCEVSLASTACL